MRIVGVCGYMGSGKSEVAKHLVENHCWKRVPFAAPLKAMLLSLGLTEEHINGKLKDQPCDLLGGKTPRWAMQSLGTEWGRNLIHPDLWVQAWKAALPNGACPGVVVDDVRFKNEKLEIARMGGVLIEIARPGFERKSEHSSEGGISGDMTIINNGTLDDLRRRVDWMLKL